MAGLRCRLLFLAAVAAAFPCPLPPPATGFYQYCADIHDGDMKCVSTSAGANPTVTITPYNSTTQKWVAKVAYNFTACQGMVDFRVPGKPNPPPVPLLLSGAKIEAGDHAVFPGWDPSKGAPTKYAAVFTDPSGTIANPAKFVNIWTCQAGSTKPIPGCS